MRVVVDTNVLVLGIINANGNPGKIVDLIRTDVIELVLDDRIFKEYADVLNRDFFKPYITKNDYDNIMEFLKYNSLNITCSRVIQDLPHQGDIPFLETALSASVPLITGNTKHFPAEHRKGCEVYTPAEFLKKYMP